MTEQERLEQTRREHWARHGRVYDPETHADFEVTGQTLPPVKPFTLPYWEHTPAAAPAPRPVPEGFDDPAADIPYADWASGGEVVIPEYTAPVVEEVWAESPTDVEVEAVAEVRQDVTVPVRVPWWKRMFARPAAAVSEETSAAGPAPEELDAGEPEPEVWATADDDQWEAPAVPATPDVDEQWQTGDPDDEAGLSNKELREKRKAEARASRPDAAERKRLAQVAKEEKERQKKRLAEASAEEKIEADEARSRARREKKNQREFDKRQKRREAVRRNGGKEGFWQGTSKPKPMEIANSVRALAIVLEVNPAEIEAVKMVAEEYAGGRIGDAFDRIYDRLVRDNLTLVQAFEPESLFPPVVHNMLRVGAKTGKPGASLRTAVDLLDAGNDNSRKMRNAVREPIIIAVLSIAMLFVTAWMVMPVFVDMYEQLDLEIGLFTTFTLVLSDIVVWGLSIGAVAATLFGIWWFAHGRWDIRVRTAIDRFKLRAPLTGKSEQSGEAFQMFNIIDSYLSVGATERETLIGAASAVNNRAVKRHLRATANGLTSGEKTFAQFLDDDMFPRLARALLATGQRTGQTNQAVKHLRETYKKEAKIEGEQAVEKVVSVISAISSLLFTVMATIVSIPPLEIFGATLSYTG